jgi:hypothetical protein
MTTPYLTASRLPQAIALCLDEFDTIAHLYSCLKPADRVEHSTSQRLFASACDLARLVLIGVGTLVVYARFPITQACMNLVSADRRSGIESGARIGNGEQQAAELLLQLDQILRAICLDAGALLVSLIELEAAPASASTLTSPVTSIRSIRVRTASLGCLIDDLLAIWLTQTEGGVLRTTAATSQRQSILQGRAMHPPIDTILDSLNDSLAYIASISKTLTPRAPHH